MKYFDIFISQLCLVVKMMACPVTFFSLSPGAGFLLPAEGARLPDEECAGSFGNHSTEPALDGRELGLPAEVAVTHSGLHSTLRCLHYPWTLSLFLQGRAHITGRRPCSTLLDEVLGGLTLVLQVVFISSGWL